MRAKKTDVIKKIERQKEYFKIRQIKVKKQEEKVKEEENIL